MTPVHHETEHLGALGGNNEQHIFFRGEKGPVQEWVVWLFFSCVGQNHGILACQSAHAEKSRCFLFFFLFCLDKNVLVCS